METSRRVSNLRDLPQDIAPPRDLWPEIRAQYEAGPPTQSAVESSRPRSVYGWSLAATIAALAIGVWLGRHMFPDLTDGAVASRPENSLVRTALVTDPYYTQERAALAASLESRINALPPESRAKVLESLKTIREAAQQIEQALGREPGNALLQELLVSTYQDEMRVLAAVHEASSVDEEI